MSSNCFSADWGAVKDKDVSDANVRSRGDSVCVVHPDGTVENASVHGEILDGLSDQGRRKERRWFIAECRTLDLTDEEIEILIGKE